MGKSSSKSFSSHDEALLELKFQRDKFIQYSKKLDYLIQRDTVTVIELTKEKENAQIIGPLKANLVLVLSKIRLQKDQLSKTIDIIGNLEEMVQLIPSYRLRKWNLK